MSAGDEGGAPAATSGGPTLTDRRQRTTRRIALWGALGGGGILAIASGLAGAEGRASFALLLLAGSVSLAAAALHAVVTLALDDVRGHPASRRRVLTAIGLFLGAAALMAMLAGIGG